MEDRTFLNKQVSEIVGITQRQVLSWTEKGLIIPIKESTGAGTKRGYNYTNLLEFGLCKKLFSLGIGFRAVKKMINDLRNINLIRDWANDFEKYYMNIFEERKAHLNKLIKEEKSKDNNDEVKLLNEIMTKHYQKPYQPDRAMGVLAYFYGDRKEQSFLIAWDMGYVINLNIIKQAFSENDSGILVDIGKIKEMIDKKV